MFLGIDLGTSSIKAVLCGDDDQLVAEASHALASSRPVPGWSEQDPDDWWRATLAVIDAIAVQAPGALARTQGIGLSGQMHGAVVLDAADEVLRPCILWNDGRSAAECEALEAALPDLRAITGNVAMPGFTAPKLLWLARHERSLFDRIHTVLLPKAYLRFRLSGERIEEMSDASGTLWLDVGARDWSDAALAATFLSRRHMPALVEGTARAGRLRPELAARWGMAPEPWIAGGAGDNAASAIGLGAVRAGDAFLSLGTSGVLWATTDRFRPNPSRGVHAFCHALPDTWHQMAVILSAAASLEWWAGIADRSVPELLAEMGEPASLSPATFLPYLSGERTPHNDARIRGGFLGLSPEVRRTDLTQAVLEGVAFALRDGLDAMREAGTAIAAATLTGGGSRSRAWATILASVLDLPLHRPRSGEHGAALGAARLGRMAATGEPAASICTPPSIAETIEPDPRLARLYGERLARFRALYPALKDIPA